VSCCRSTDPERVEPLGPDGSSARALPHVSLSCLIRGIIGSSVGRCRLGAALVSLCPSNGFAAQPKVVAAPARSSFCQIHTEGAAAQSRVRHESSAISHTGSATWATSLSVSSRGRCWAVPHRRRRAARCPRRARTAGLATRVLAAVYVAGFVHFTLFPIIVDRGQNLNPWYTQVQPVPFLGTLAMGPSFVLNVILFVPLGMLLLLLTRAGTLPEAGSSALSCRQCGNRSHPARAVHAVQQRPDSGRR
jgi:hypothetical protein